MTNAYRKHLSALLPAAVLLSLLLASCGGSSGTASGPVQVARKVTPVSHFPGLVAPTRHRGVTARGQAGLIDDEVNASGAKPPKPCSYVSAADAEAILGKAVGQPVEAPQGPTCIFRAQGIKGPVTIALQTTGFSNVKPQAQLRDRMSVTVNGHAAYCGVAGLPTMIVPLTPGRFLTVTAPCPIAASFAAKALSQIKA